MSIPHNFIIENLQTEFKQINELYDEIQLMRTKIQERLIEVKKIYNDLIKHNNKKIFMFCLDTFYFQYKVLNIEIDNINRFISLINNRMYGDYYKLHTIMTTQSSQYIVDNSGNSEIVYKTIVYNPYRELEPFHEYLITDIQSIHQDIIQIINIIYAFYSKKDADIQNYSIHQIGLSIDSFIHTLKYENKLVDEQIQLYINYVSFFHKMQLEYLSKLLNKIQQFYSELEEDMLSNTSLPNTDLDQCYSNLVEPTTLFTIIDFTNSPSSEL
jgi:hypothetical protein